MSSTASVDAARPARGWATWGSWAGWAFTAALLALTATVFYGMGPRFDDPAWYEPTAWLALALGETDLYPIADELRHALALFGGLALALAAAVFATTRQATARFLAVFAVLSTVCLLYYGINAPFVWEFFGWRWSGSMLLFTATTAAAATAPLLAASWLRLPVWARALVYLPLLALVLVYERNITGTDQALRFAISPWPVVQIFGIELFGMCLGALILGVGLGLWLVSRPGAAGAPARLAGALAAGALPTLALWGASEQNLLPGKVTGGALLALFVLAAAIFAAASVLGLRGERARAAARARHWLVAGLLVLLPTFLGQLWARADYVTTRDDRAQLVIDALAGYFEREGIYPDRLDELVEEGALKAVPSPRIGFRTFSDQEFVYQNFGTNYLLEFSAPRWIQCAYNPPYPEEYEDEYEEEEDAEALGVGSWSCPSKPPELW